MTVFTNESNNQRGECNMNRNDLPHIHPMPHHLHPMPHHERRGMLRFTFDEKDREALLAVFGDPNSAAAAESIIYNAPPEVQILAIQALSMTAHTIGLPQSQPVGEKEDDDQDITFGAPAENRIRWSCPVLDEAASKQFRQIYGEAGYSFCTILCTAPYEIAVVARILAYVNEKAGEMNYGHH